MCSKGQRLFSPECVLPNSQYSVGVETKSQGTKEKPLLHLSGFDSAAPAGAAKPGEQQICQVLSVPQPWSLTIHLASIIFIACFCSHLQQSPLLSLLALFFLECFLCLYCINAHREEGQLAGLLQGDFYRNIVPVFFFFFFQHPILTCEMAINALLAFFSWFDNVCMSVALFVHIESAPVGMRMISLWRIFML